MVQHAASRFMPCGTRPRAAHLISLPSDSMASAATPASGSHARVTMSSRSSFSFWSSSLSSSSASSDCREGGRSEAVGRPQAAAA